MIPLQILQEIPDNEKVGIISILVALASALSGVLIYMYREHKADMKEKDSALEEVTKNHLIELRLKDAKIDEITKSHQQDLKDGIEDYKSIIDKYYILFERVKDWQDARRGL